MNTDELSAALVGLFSELVDGASESGGFMLNAGDPGLMRSLDRLSAESASAPTVAGSSIAAHTDHLRYGVSLMNRWAAGGNPYQDADWKASWRRTTVSDAEWSDLRRQLREELDRWVEALRSPRDVNEIELKGIVGSMAHLAYHLGAIRQIDSATRGPNAEVA